MEIKTKGLRIETVEVPRAEMLEGAPIIVTTKPTWKPKTYREYECVWDDSAGSGDVYYCRYVQTLQAWRGVIITALP